MAVEPLIFELSCPGRRGVQFPPADVPTTELPSHLRRDRLDWPEVSEIDVIRHFTRVSQKNHAIDINIYPLGSCTMKYNPKINEAVARYAGVRQYPSLSGSEATVQGALELMYELQEMLAKISGFPHVTLQPAAGAQGELTGVLVIRAYHHARGDDRPHEDSRSGLARTARTRRPPPWPASRSSLMPSDARGNCRSSTALRELVGPDTAGLMITNPNTLGLWDEHIREAIMGRPRGRRTRLQRRRQLQRDSGHRAAGRPRHRHHALQPAQDLLDPARRRRSGLRAGGSAQRIWSSSCPDRSRVEEDGEDGYGWVQPERSASGACTASTATSACIVRAYTYIRMHGAEGLRQISEDAVLNANYLRANLRDRTTICRYDRTCMHEFVLSANRQKALGVRDARHRQAHARLRRSPADHLLPADCAGSADDRADRDGVEGVARLLHPARCTRSRTRRETNPELVTTAPHNTEYKRLDDVAANRALNLRWEPQHAGELVGAAAD